ncbi:hypothetical protein AAFF_G00005220 [Aldrovandia affinis]|uniref:Uncharacterized protein n=1 Tax=Aldrovandia affinis TaxID=143900 RepID=A0AAD7X3Y7_9TELE|nr:hypothetical protein AAFF_G00005220 [Aldrovandia affinis]
MHQSVRLWRVLQKLCRLEVKVREWDWSPGYPLTFGSKNHKRKGVKEGQRAASVPHCVRHAKSPSIPSPDLQPGEELVQRDLPLAQQCVPLQARALVHHLDLDGQVLHLHGGHAVEEEVLVEDRVAAVLDDGASLGPAPPRMRRCALGLGSAELHSSVDSELWRANVRLAFTTLACVSCVKILSSDAERESSGELNGDDSAEEQVSLSPPLK